MSRAGERLRALARDRWWAQAAIVFAVFQVFRVARIAFEGSPATALANALDVIDLQDTLGLLHEETLQRWLGEAGIPARAWNVFYGFLHDTVGALALVFLWRVNRERYRFWRNVAGWMLALGLVGFVVYPITPPRLMPAEYGFVDTGVEIGGIGPVRGASPSGGGNRFAAMPSLHVGRAAWAAVAVVPLLRRRWAKTALVAYPFVMTLATMVTANHWLLDAVGGVAALAVALALERSREHLVSRLPRRSRPAASR